MLKKEVARGNKRSWLSRRLEVFLQHAKIDDALGAITAIELINVSCINVDMLSLSMFRLTQPWDPTPLRADCSSPGPDQSTDRSFQGLNLKHTEFKQDLFILSRHHTLASRNQPTVHSGMLTKQYWRSFHACRPQKKLLNWFHLNKFMFNEQINKCKSYF